MINSDCESRESCQWRQAKFCIFNNLQASLEIAENTLLGVCGGDSNFLRTSWLTELVGSHHIQILVVCKFLEKMACQLFAFNV